MKAIVTLEIETKDDIAHLYPNFIFNYNDKRDFLIQQIASLNHNISLDEQIVYKNYHPNFENNDYKIYDDGYKQTVTKIDIEPSHRVSKISKKLYQIIVLCDNELEILLQNLSYDDMKKEYLILCKEWYIQDSLEKFKIENKDDYDEMEIYDAYKISEDYFSADDRANVIWEIMI